LGYLFCSSSYRASVTELNVKETRKQKTKKGDNQELLFLRRHNPDQVQRVLLRPLKTAAP
jgi:hypothetical protein